MYRPIGFLVFHLISNILSASSQYCGFTNQESINKKETISEEKITYMYFDIENYDKKKFNDLHRSDNFSLEGDFGTMTKINNTEDVEYSAYEISIHVPPEHLIGDLDAEVEVMIHHISADNNTLILSFLFTTGDHAITTSSRMFFSDLIDAASGSEEIDPVDISGGFYQIKKFYFAESTQNSENKCSKFDWAIYSEIQKISSSDLKKLKEKLVIENKTSRMNKEVDYDYYSGDQDDFGLILGLGISFFLI